MMKKHVFAFAGAIAVLATAAVADPLPKQQFKVVGTWGTASMYKDYEAPMWPTDVPKASEGKIKTDVQAITDLGLSGTETIKLLSTSA
jgi:hypothetical protein